MRLSDDNSELIRVAGRFSPLGPLAILLATSLKFSSPGKKRKSWAAEGLLKALGASRLRSDWTA
jgi:hypothetical protein